MAWDLARGQVGYFPEMETGALRKKTDAELEDYLVYLDFHLYEVRNGENRDRYKGTYVRGILEEQRRIRTVIRRRKAK